MQTNLQAFAVVSIIWPLLVLATAERTAGQVQDLHDHHQRFAIDPTVLDPVTKNSPVRDPTTSAKSRYEIELFAEQPIAQSTNLPVVSNSYGSVRPTRLLDRVWADHMNLYSPDSLLLVGFSLGVGAVFANSSFDTDIQRHLQSSLRSANSDDWLEGLHANKELGDGRFTLPIFAGAWALGSLLPESEFSAGSRMWGGRTLRGLLVGTPPVLLLQHVTGGSRPGETASGSDWKPFQDNNGVSGHAFMGALPFITAAKMSEKPGWKAAFYAASALAPLSRAGDGAHYPSQVALGWSMAFVAATAVYSSDNPDSRWRVLPTITPAGSGMALEYRF